jgi:hypothetical protein
MELPFLCSASNLVDRAYRGSSSLNKLAKIGKKRRKYARPKPSPKPAFCGTLSLLARNLHAFCCCLIWQHFMRNINVHLCHLVAQDCCNMNTALMDRPRAKIAVSRATP